jgi:phosphoribosylglycinamide formyltransferase 2
MQVAHGFEVINMLDGALDRIVAKHKPDFIVPEIEAIRTERFTITKKGITVVPSAKAANFTMNRKAIRDLASKELGLNSRYATTAAELRQGVEAVNALRSKATNELIWKGQSTIKTDADIEKAWQYAVEGSRGDVVEVIVEACQIQFGDHFINCCPKQQSYFVLCTNRPPTRTGDYQESWQPATILDKDLYEAKTWLKKLPKP